MLSFSAKEEFFPALEESLESTPEKEAAKSVLTLDEAALTLYEGLKKGEKEISFEGVKCTPHQLHENFQKLVYSCPELFFVNTGAQYSYSLYNDKESGNQYVVKVYPAYYSYGAQTLEEVIAEYTAMMNELCALGSMEWSDLETALFYHDYLTAHYEYDTNYQIYDAYGFLKNKKGVCQAYTLVFRGLMDYFDVPCTFAQSNNINHIWNVVFVDGEWFHIDATWDDPVADRPGRARHDLFLIGVESNEQMHFTSKMRENDMVLGADVTISEDDHRYTHIWKETEVPFVEASGHFYGIVKVVELLPDEFGVEQEKQSFKFSEIHFEKGGQITSYDTLPMIWQTTVGWYGGNYSGMCTDGRYVYYSDSKNIYRYDPEDGQKTPVKVYDGEKVLSGLLFEEEKLMACLGNTPYEGLYLEEVLVKLPVYHTITWIIDGEKHFTVAEEGTVPEFDGSVWKESENGISYQFMGWTPELSNVYCEMTYVAIYKIVYEYIPGDVSGDGEITISDVTALLDYISNPEGAIVNMSALDTDGSGNVTISDVTLLLDFLAGQDVTLN